MCSPARHGGVAVCLSVCVWAWEYRTLSPGGTTLASSRTGFQLSVNVSVGPRAIIDGYNLIIAYRSTCLFRYDHNKSTGSQTSARLPTAAFSRWLAAHAVSHCWRLNSWSDKSLAIKCYNLKWPNILILPTQPLDYSNSFWTYRISPITWTPSVCLLTCIVSEENVTDEANPISQNF